MDNETLPPPSDWYLENIAYLTGQLAQRDAKIRELETFREQHQLACSYMDEWEQAGGDAPHRVVRLVDRMKVQRDAAEVAARNMRDLVAEHVRERGALQNRLVISERECEWWCLRYKLKLGPSEWNAAVNDFADDKELDGRQDLPT